MTGPFLYLWWRSLANRVHRKSAQVRNPRYALALLAGIAYLWFFLSHRSPAPASPGRGIEFLAAFGLALVLAWAWVFGRTPAGFTFSPAEVTFLFPAPVSRRRLISAKLARAQLLILRYTLLWTVILTRGPWNGRTAMHAAGIWIALSTLHLHRVGASLVRGDLAGGEPGARRRHRLVLAIVALGGVMLAVSLARVLPLAGAARHGGAQALLDAVAASASSGAVASFLAPFRALVAPVIRTEPAAWARALPAALGLLLLHCVWVLRSDAAFEEGAVAAADARSRELLPASGDQADRPRLARAGRPVFRLAATGAPAVAIYWKNLLAVTRAGTARRVAALTVMGAVVAGVASAQTHSSALSTVGILAGTWALLSVVVGPQWVRNDLRADLLHLELLRSFPLTGAQIVAAEVSAATVVLSATQAGLVLVAYGALLGAGDSALSLKTRTVVAMATVLVMPAVNYLGLLLQNGAALLFPAWVHLGPRRAGGVEALGQNTLAMIVYAAVLALALVPPVLAAAVVGWALWPAWGMWALAPAGAITVAGVTLEARLLLGPLGRVFERIDIADAGLQRP